MSDYREGQTATHKDGRKIVFRSGQWVNYSSAPRGPHTAKTTPQDMEALTKASLRSAAEADAQREYGDLSKAVRTFGTSPGQSLLADMFLPNPSDGYPVLDELGTIAGVIGSAGGRLPWLDDKLVKSRDRINTASARSAINASAQLTGAASDRDMALLRTSGISTSKSVAENERILRQARTDSVRSEARALLTNKWIARYGSLSQASPNGMTFEDAVQYANRDLEAQRRKSTLPKPPPSIKARSANSGQRQVFDINGNPVR